MKAKEKEKTNEWHYWWKLTINSNRATAYDGNKNNEITIMRTLSTWHN